MHGLSETPSMWSQHAAGIEHIVFLADEEKRLTASNVTGFLL